MAQDTREFLDVLQVKLVAGVVFRNQRDRACVRTGFFDGRHCGLHTQRMEIGIEVVEAAGKQVGIDRCELESGIAQVNGGVKRRRMILPLRAQPVFNVGVGLQDVAFQFLQRAGQCGSQARYGHDEDCSRSPTGFLVTGGLERKGKKKRAP